MADERSPKVYRAMRRDPADGLPVVGSIGSSELGVRPGVDVAAEAGGNVALDGTGVSVAPEWRQLDFSRIPRRLRHLVPGASGANGTACYMMGEGPFHRAPFAVGLELIPDDGPVPVAHGVIAPTAVVPLAHYQNDLANTRDRWRIDES